jgi:hypothetical protein
MSYGNLFTGAELRRLTFSSQHKGYDDIVVNALIEEIATAVDEGASVTDLLSRVDLPKLKPSARHGYDLHEVDTLIDHLRRATPERDGSGVALPNRQYGSPFPWPGNTLTAHWYALQPEESSSRPSTERVQLQRDLARSLANFGQLPGTHIGRRRIGRGRSELMASDAQVVAVVEEGFAWGHTLGLRTVTYVGQEYRIRRVGKAADDNFELVDITSENVALRITGRHFHGFRNSVVRVSDEHWYGLPVYGTSPADCVMIATEETGRRVARFTRPKRGLEGKSNLQRAHRVQVIVNPTVRIPAEVVLMIAVASGFTVSWYAYQPSGH